MTMIEERTTVMVTRDRREKLDQIAAEEGKTVVEIVDEALDEYCKENKVS